MDNSKLNTKIIELKKIEKEYNEIQVKIKENNNKFEKIKKDEARINEKINHITFDNVDLSSDPILRRTAQNTENYH